MKKETLKRGFDNIYWIVEVLSIDINVFKLRLIAYKPFLFKGSSAQVRLIGRLMQDTTTWR